MRNRRLGTTSLLPVVAGQVKKYLACLFEQQNFHFTNPRTTHAGPNSIVHSLCHTMAWHHLSDFVIFSCKINILLTCSAAPEIHALLLTTMPGLLAAGVTSGPTSSARVLFVRDMICLEYVQTRPQRDVLFNITLQNLSEYCTTSHM